MKGMFGISILISTMISGMLLRQPCTALTTGQIASSQLPPNTMIMVHLLDCFLFVNRYALTFIAKKIAICAESTFLI